MSNRINATKKQTKYTLGLDPFTLKLIEGVNVHFNEISGTKVSKSLLVRKAIQDYTGRLLTSGDPCFIEGELNAIRAMK